MTVPNQFYTPQRRYAVRLWNGTTYQTDNFDTMPDQFKALSWLYAYDNGGRGMYAMFLQSLASERATMRQWSR